MAWLTMAASFLNLDHANRSMNSPKQKNVVNMMDIAVKRFDLKEHLKNTFAEEISGGKQWETVEGGSLMVAWPPGLGTVGLCVLVARGRVGVAVFGTAAAGCQAGPVAATVVGPGPLVSTE